MSHIWMSHITHTNEAHDTRRCHNSWVLFTQLSHVAYEKDTSHMYKVFRTWMKHQWMSHGTYEWGKWHKVMSYHMTRAHWPQLQKESWGCGSQGHYDNTQNWSTCVRLEDRIASIVLPVPPPDLEVPPPATGCCGSIQIFEGWSAKCRTPSFPSQSESLDHVWHDSFVCVRATWLIYI